MDLIYRILKDLKWFYEFQQILWILRNNWKNIITHSLSKTLNKNSYLFYFIFYERVREREKGGERGRDSKILKEKKQS